MIYRSTIKIESKGFNLRFTNSGSIQRPDVEILELLLVMEPLLGALGPQLARPRALYLDDLLGGGVLGNKLFKFKSSI